MRDRRVLRCWSPPGLPRTPPGLPTGRPPVGATGCTTASPSARLGLWSHETNRRTHVRGRRARHERCRPRSRPHR
ncbi:hypothetical protein DVS28_a3491 [Euzebya pacifica]|uniref:Uncharacterized protein n=1 Tax=Euzebya pacifica TaxID=1608957 RepID=A0A346Y117_9ACTN|nr:hypothetical protein DVS28_a3491 [Euzebya pacifica]